MKKSFTNNFQGTYKRLSTKHDLAMCARKSRTNPSMTTTAAFGRRKSECVQLTKSEVIHTFHNMLTDRYLYREFSQNHPKTLKELRHFITAWVDADNQECERFNKRSSNNPHQERKPQGDQKHRDSYSRNDGNSCKKDSGNIVASMQRSSRRLSAQQRKEEFEKLLHK